MQIVHIYQLSVRVRFKKFFNTEKHNKNMQETISKLENVTEDNSSMEVPTIQCYKLSLLHYLAENNLALMKAVRRRKR